MVGFAEDDVVLEAKRQTTCSKEQTYNMLKALWSKDTTRGSWPYY